MADCLKSDLIELCLRGNGIDVALSPSFMQEIETRKQAVAMWEQVREDHSDNLPEKPPRLHHYLFMCRALPAFAYKDPVKLAQTLDSELAGRFLEIVWNIIGQAVGEEHNIPSLEWSYSKHCPIAEMDILCLQFSPPIQEEEVWMAALVKPPVKKRLFLPSSPHYRFYTLESGLLEIDDGQTVIRQWEKGWPKNRLRVPASDESEFVRAIVVDATAQ